MFAPYFSEWDLLVSCSADLGLGAADRMHSLRLDEEASISRPQPVQVMNCRWHTNASMLTVFSLSVPA